MPAGSKKFGRNKKKLTNQNYTLEQRWEKNKKRREWQTAKCLKKYSHLSKDQYFNLPKKERLNN
tara:strand:- start:1490 stop:1681 length:192 start_codon:yes stop_codon:yes gene_type:complete